MSSNREGSRISAFSRERAPERAQIRKNYTHLAHNLSNVRLTENSATNGVVQIIHGAEENLDKTETFREMRMDARLTKTLTKKMDGILTSVMNEGRIRFDANDFAVRLMNRIQPPSIGEEQERLDLEERLPLSQRPWAMYENVCAKVFRRPPHLQKLNQHFSVKQQENSIKEKSSLRSGGLGGVSKKRFAPATATKDKVAAPATKVREIKAAHSELEDVKDQLMKSRIGKAKESLKESFEKNKNHPVHYFRFVTDPVSFENTVRNVLTVSFLLNRNEVSLIFDDNDQPYIFLVDDEDDLENLEGSRLDVTMETVDAGNWIVSVSEEEWQEIVKVYKIQQAMIKNVDEKR